MHFHYKRYSLLCFYTAVLLFTESSSFQTTTDEESMAPGEAKSNSLGQCSGAPCYNQEECCAETACVKPDGHGIGKCTRLIGQSEGALCVAHQKPQSCAAGLFCVMMQERSRSPLGVCVRTDLKYAMRSVAESCKSTIDCDYTQDLCCQVRMHGRNTEQRICDYFEDLITDCLFK